MPIYEYVCEKCGKEKEVFQKVNDTAPVCCDQEMKRLMSLAGFKLVGGNWYKDGYTSKSNKKGK
jgi:putative FmdB family regulatory protein